MEQQKQKTNVIAIITMFFLFAMISFVTNQAELYHLSVRCFCLRFQCLYAEYSGKSDVEPVRWWR